MSNSSVQLQSVRVEVDGGPLLVASVLGFVALGKCRALRIQVAWG